MRRDRVKEFDDAIERSDMGKFGRDVQDLVLHLVNTEGIRWRKIDANHLLLYPPDGVGRPFKIASARPAERTTEFVERQFMAVYGVKDADGHVPYTKEEPEVATSMEDTVAPEVSDAHEAVRTLASALGVSLGGSVSEEDYLAVVAEKDACQAEVERHRANAIIWSDTVTGLEETVSALTEQRDSLLTRVHDLEDDIAQAVANLTRSVKS